MTENKNLPQKHIETPVKNDGVLEQRTFFRCSNHLLNQLFDDILREQHQRSASAMKDCGIGLFANAGSYNMNMASLYAEMLQQRNHIADRIMLLWQMLRKYSDVDTVKKYLPESISALEIIEKNSSRFPLISDFGMNDRLNFDDPTPPELLNSAWFAGLNLICSRMADALGEKASSAKCMAVYENVRSAFLKEFYNEKLRFKGESQTAMVLAIYFDLTPDDSDLWALVVEDLLKSIEKKHNMHFSTGVSGLSLLLPALTKAEALDTAYQLLLQSSFPSWLYPVIRSEAVEKDFDFYAFGAVIEWFFEGICGIQPDPTFKRFKLDPRFGRFLDFAEAAYNSIYGPIVSKWSRDGEDFIHEFTVPCGTEAVVRNKVYSPGKYSIKIKHY